MLNPDLRLTNAHRGCRRASIYIEHARAATDTPTRKSIEMWSACFFPASPLDNGISLSKALRTSSAVEYCLVQQANSRPNRFECACGSDIFHAALASNAKQQRWMVLMSNHGSATVPEEVLFHQQRYFVFEALHFELRILTNPN